VKRKKTILFGVLKQVFVNNNFFCSPSFPSCLALEKDQTCWEMYQISVVEKKQNISCSETGFCNQCFCSPNFLSLWSLEEEQTCWNNLA
jgi:hypothetical protein